MWVFQSKMEFNLDHTKQAIKVYFSHKIVSNKIKQFSFNRSQVKISDLTLETKLTFKEYKNK